MTFETAARDTPASSATSEMDGRFLNLDLYGHGINAWP
jgi:hypothetical protein